MHYLKNLMKEYTYHLNYGIVSQQNPSPNILQIYSAICCPMPHPGWIYVVEGGNTIQFAKIFDNIGALDINPINLYCTKQLQSLWCSR